MKKNRLIILSDAHIGVNAATNWYQRAIHEPTLLAVFDYIEQHAEAIAEVILLGDFVDQWMYLPPLLPPTFDQIVSANPGVFTRLLDLLDRLDGKITYVRGNHDGLVTPHDVEQLKSPRGLTLNMASGWLYTPALGEGQIICTHGHIYSILCAPNFYSYPEYPGLPLGYFAGRFYARWCEQHLGPETPTAAQLSHMGAPGGRLFFMDELLGLVQTIGKGHANLAELMITILSDATHHQDDSVYMPDARRISISDISQIYRDLLESYPGGTNVTPDYFGDLASAAALALTETDLTANLDHFAHELARRYAVVVMGHTHHALLKRMPAALYVNSGLNCPAVPDMHKGVLPSFTGITWDQASAELMVSLYHVISQEGGYDIRLACPAQTIPRRILSSLSSQERTS